MTAKQFRRIALGMEGAVEGSHMGHPDFRAANGKIFATLNEDETRAMASLTPDEQFELMKRAPEVFVPAAGAWGRQGSTMIVLAKATDEIVGEAVTLAWKRISAGPAARSKQGPSKTTRGTSSSPPRRGRKRPS
jgi:YjbR